MYQTWWFLVETKNKTIEYFRWQMFIMMMTIWMDFFLSLRLLIIFIKKEFENGSSFCFSIDIFHNKKKQNFLSFFQKNWNANEFNDIIRFNISLIIFIFCFFVCLEISKKKREFWISVWKCMGNSTTTTTNHQ